MFDKKMICLTLAIIMIGTLAQGQNTKVWEGIYVNDFRSSFVTLDKPVEPSAVATVTFYNDFVHETDEVFPLIWNDITVNVRVEYNVLGGAERLVVTTEPGYIAIPADILVEEKGRGEINIYKFLGM